MRRLFIGVCLLWMTSVASADLAKPIRVLQHDIPHAAPFFADVDGDGKQDLLVGQFQDDPYTGARVRLFRNIGTTDVPKFDEGTFLQAGRTAVACDEFFRTGFGPQLVDFNGDGQQDLISGSRDCELFVFRNAGKGQFDAARRLKYIDPEQREFRRLGSGRTR